MAARGDVNCYIEKKFDSRFGVTCCPFKGDVHIKEVNFYLKSY